MPYRVLSAGAAAFAVAAATLSPASAATAPPKPAACSAAKVDGGYSISWTPASTDGGSALTGFTLREQGYSQPLVRVGAQVRSHVWTTELRDTADIRFAVRATNAIGISTACVTAPVSSGSEENEPQPEVGNDVFLPYAADSFFKSRADRLPIDATRTASFRAFMRTHPDQKATPYPKVNVNPDWAMSYALSDANDPIWRLKGGNTTYSKLALLTTKGFHMPDAVADSFPTGDQDRPGVIVDRASGFTVQFADAVPDKATRTITVSNAGIMWHSSNGLDYRNPRSNDSRNFTSRGRILDAMVIRRDVLDEAMAKGTGLGHVMHLFFVENETAAGVAHPMVGTESAGYGWGAEGERIRLRPDVNLVARGLTGAALAIARTLQENGAYIGDNSGSSTQIKASQPHHYVGTNLTTDAFKGKITWDDFEVVARGAQ